MAWLVSLCFFWDVVILGLAVVQCPRLFFTRTFYKPKLPHMKKHYHRFCNKASCLILTTLLTMSVSTKLSAQQDVAISTELLNSIDTKNLNVFTVLQTEVGEPKRLAYVIETRVTDFNQIIGNFKMLPEKFKLAGSDDSKGKFFQNELVDDAKKYDSFRLLERPYRILKNDESQKLYVLYDDNISAISKGLQTKDLLDIVHKLGYKEYENGGEKYIKSKTSEIRLDVRTYQELKTNPNYISTLDNDQIKIASLVKQTAVHSKTLDKYLSIYRIKRSKMSSTDLTAWRNATKQAQKLNDQIYALNEKYDGNYSVMPINKTLNSTLETFADNVLASKGVLGM